MKKYKLIMSAGLFLILTAVKLISPSSAAGIRERTLDIIDRNDNYEQVAGYIEELRAPAGAEETPLPADESGPQTQLLPVIDGAGDGYRIETLGARTSGSLPVIVEYTPGEKEADEADAPAAQSEPAAEPAEEPPAAVAEFLESQEAFADYAVPEKATYDYIELSLSYASPVAGLTSSGFGYRMHPIHGEVRFHYGTDFAAHSGTDIHAFASGTVTFAGYDSSYGNFIRIDHGGGLQTLYAHCSTLYVSSGESVERGELIALVGATGLVTGPHLHFELTKDGRYLNPEYYINSL